jgi:DNA/RNA-binding domain of Phe-tRNA-synthetase-like protein
VAEPPADPDVAPEPGWVAPALAEEFPGLGLLCTPVEGAGGRSPEAVKEKLRELSDRFAGAQAVVLRQRPIPWGYRVFYRHIGLDPDRTPTPVEQLALDRMRDGRFRSQNRLADAITIATMETGAAVRPFDADAVSGRLGLRLSEPEESFEGRASPLPEGTIVIADEERALEILFGATAKGRGAGSGTPRVLLAAVRVKGVPDVALEEALWLAVSALNA